MSRLLDQSFKYIPAAKTNIRKTFERIKREQRAEEQRQEASRIATQNVVRQLKKVKA